VSSKGVVKRDVAQSSCSSDNLVCTELVDNVAQFTNNAYIEMSVQVKFPEHKNIQIIGMDGKKVASWVIRTVLPARQPGGDPTVTSVFTMKEPTSGTYSWAWNYMTRFGSFKAKTDGTKYRLPFTGKFKVGQGYNGGVTHTGANANSIDFTMPEGTSVLASRGGVVAALENSNWQSKYDPGVCPKPVSRKCDAPGSGDNNVFIRHEDGTFGMYAHFKQDGVIVSLGDTVTSGQLLGYSGNTGLSTGPHLHVSVNRANAFGGNDWTSVSLKVSYTNVNDKTVNPAKGKEYEGA
jgi:murein DD-endopeptidase MepM/ murein hydrolase activator NlpD